MGERQPYSGLEVAVIGMAGRFPGAASVDRLWSNLLAGVESISRFSASELRAEGVDDATLANPAYVPAAGVIAGAELFDAGFFGYSPREAALIDPQQRLLLETAWAALEHAGYGPGSVEDVVGVYAGVGWSDYALHCAGAAGEHELDHSAVVANDKDFAATRLSYKLNLSGPGLSIQTACSTSLVAIHMACQGIIAGECEMAVAGGLTVRARQRRGYLYQEEGIASPDGHCRAFSARAQGCVPGNGGGVVVLKSLTRAIADRDTIHAVIRGSAINNDGARKVGFTAPSADGQTAVIRAALRVAGIAADDVGYLEAHGTGTLLGDPIEIAAATRAFGGRRAKGPSCVVGSVKSNLGHLDAGAGVTGFIKASLAVRDGRIPPSLHSEPPNPAIDFANSPFAVSESPRAWPLAAGPRIAGVSAFGIGGTNAHVVIEEPPPAHPFRSIDGPELVVVSAKSIEALDQLCLDLATHLSEHPAPRLADAAHTLRRGRSAMPFRRALVAGSVDQAAGLLRSSVGANVVPCVDPHRIVFMFPGQGSQYIGMAGGLYATYPEFRACFDRCADVVRARTAVDLRDFITSSPDETLRARLRDTGVAQPAIFSVSYSLAQLVMGWGLRPSALVGHSLGEYVAACVAGVMPLDDALALVVDRGARMSALPAGAMAAVPLPPEQLEPLLPPQLAIAAINAADRCVVSGEAAAVATLLDGLAAQGIDGRPLSTSHAFHSPMVDGLMEEWARRVARVPLQPPRMPYASNLTGTWITAAEATDPGYYARHLRRPVRFADNLDVASHEPGSLLLELGPGQTLTALARRYGRAASRDLVAVPATRRAEESTPDAQVLLDAVGQLWARGAAADWARMPTHPDVRRVPLPTYPFRRERHVVEAPSRPPSGPLPSPRAEMSDWFSVPSWERLPQSAPSLESLADPHEAWVVMLDAHGVGAHLVALLRERGALVVTATQAGAGGAPGDVTLRVDEPLDYQRLLSELRRLGREHLRFVHCWSLDATSSQPGLDLAGERRRGFDSLLALAQAVGEQAWVSSWRLAVVTSQVFEVVGGEQLRPAKAMVLGPCRTIPLEYSGARTVVIDLELDPAASEARTLAGRTLRALLRATAPIETMALRGRYEWRAVQAPLQIGPASGSAFRARGTYLITGGRGGVGLALAEYLARTVQANLVLVGRTPVPPPSRNSESSAGRSRALDAFDRAARGLSRQPGPLPPARSAESRHALDDLCSAYAWRFFEQAGLGTAGAWTHERSTLWERCHTLPKFQRYVDALVQMLLDDGLLALDGGAVRSLPHRAPIDLSQARARARDLNPSLEPLLDLLDACAARLDEALSGAIPAVELLFGDEAQERFQRAVGAIRAQSWTPVCEGLAGELVSAIVQERQNTSTRFLEIGGGEGLLTRALIPHLRGKAVEYTFTDIGRSFVLGAQRRAAADGDGFMRFETLDISKPPTRQGFSEGCADVVLAFNVLHATSSVAAGISHARALLAPGGLLVLQESVTSERWVDFVWGLTDGWWAFDDAPLRHRSPLLSADQWVQVLQDAGFTDVTVQPGREGEAPDTVLIVGVAPGVAATQGAQAAGDLTFAALRRIEALGSAVVNVTADVADEAAMQRVVADAERRFGRLDGVIHAALQLRDGAIQGKTREAAAEVFQPKVDGTLALKSALAGRPLDLFVMFSSLVSTISGAGQVDYCAASNFQDAFAFAERGTLARQVVSIDWAAWGDVGKALRSVLERGGVPEEALAHGMSSAEGFEALERALASGSPQVIVSPEDLRSIARRRSLDAPPGVSEPAAASTAPVPGDAMTGVERVIADIWRDVLGVPAVEPTDNFFDLGGDSVISLQFIARAKKAGLRLTSRQVFELQTVAALAEAVGGDGT